MSTQQPKWRLVAQLGDRDPVTYGGYFVYRDTSGVYPPEVEVLQERDPDNGITEWTVYRFTLEHMTYTEVPSDNGRPAESYHVLSDNQFHPLHAVWFGDQLQSIADTIGSTVADLLAGFLSVDPVARAESWRAVGDHFGYHELDQYPFDVQEAQ